MRRARAACAASLLVLACWAAPAHAGRDLAPFEAMRNLQQLQDQIAEGDAIAEAAHAKSIERAARVFAEARPGVWAESRNARALILYLFSGGSGVTIAEAVPMTVLPAEYRKLYHGALAYSLGNDEEARDTLLPIDARTAPQGLGAQLALVQASLTPEKDQARAIALLDLARLLAPGTLIEEAALRREMTLIAATGSLEKFSVLARRYLGAFRHSVYADSFRQLVASTAMRISKTDSDEAGLSLARIAESLDKDDRRRLYLAIARAAVLAGHVKMAVLAGQEAKRLSAPGGQDEARALVYFGAAAIIGDRFDEGQKALKSARSDRLSPKDNALRVSAVALSDVIRKPPDPDAAAVAPMQSDVVAQAERALSEADQLLNRASK